MILRQKPLHLAKEYKDQASVSPIVANKWMHIAVVVDRGAPCSANDDPSFVQCSRIEVGWASGASGTWYFRNSWLKRPVILQIFAIGSSGDQGVLILTTLQEYWRCDSNTWKYLRCHC